MKNSRILTALFAIVFVFSAFSQDIFFVNKNFIPNKKDSNNFTFLSGASFFVPEPSMLRIKSNQASLRGVVARRGEMEMLYVLRNKYSADFCPHLFFRAEAFPSYYFSSRFGAGFTHAKSRLTFGILHGKYYRLVSYDKSNFVTRKQKPFQTSSMTGFYFALSDCNSSVAFSLAKELDYIFHSFMLSHTFGQSLFCESGSLALKSLGVVASSQSFVGHGAGLFFHPTKTTRLTFQYVSPNQKEVDDYRSLLGGFSRGCLASFCLFVY